MAQMLRVRRLLVAAAVAAAAPVAAAAGGAHHSPHMGTSFNVQYLVSDQPGMAAHTDANLVNAWGLAASAGSPWWVADNGTDVATVYDGSGNPFPAASPIVVGVPNAPTGLVASSGSAFVVGMGAAAGASRFIFSTEEGKILGWHPGLAQAMLGADASSSGAIYKGLALLGDRLYATDFHNGRVDMYDASFHPVTMPNAFVDSAIPPRFAPFGIQALDGAIYVTYAKQDKDAEDDLHGHGLGFVDKFDPNGQLLARVASGGSLNAPWGLALAPAGFGRFGGDLLVGNFGNGKIHAFKAQSGNPNAFDRDGHLRASDGSPVAIDGLWALEFGLGGANNGPATTLFFTAGPDDESHGLFGSITAAS